MQEAGLLTTDIYYRFNEENYKWVALTNWTYKVCNYVSTVGNINYVFVYILHAVLDPVGIYLYANVLQNRRNNKILLDKSLIKSVR